MLCQPELAAVNRLFGMFRPDHNLPMLCQPDPDADAVHCQPDTDAVLCQPELAAVNKLFGSVRSDNKLRCVAGWAK